LIVMRNIILILWLVKPWKTKR